MAADLVANKEFYTADAVDKIRVNKANEIIARGGIYTGANAGFEGLMTVSVNDNTVTAEIDETIYGLGIGFVLDGNTIYFGSDEGTAVDTNGANGRYRKLVIKDGKVILEDSVTQEAVVLSLESVNIEFIETAVAEKEAAEDSVFEPDFIPVL